MGINGLAIATSITQAILLVSVFVYACCSSQVSRVMQPIDREAFKSWWPYLKISLPATIMLCSEWWAFEILIVLAGMLGVNELASQIIVITVSALLFMIPLGIQEASSSIIGNCIGANNVPLAKRFFAIINKLTLGIVCVICLGIGLFRNQIVTLFVTDEVVVAMTVPVILLTAFNMIFDGMQGYLQGPIRGLGL